MFNSEPPLFVEGIELFNRGKYFEAHEAWEALWQTAEGDESERLFYQALVQAAVTLVHRGRGNERGVAKMRVRVGEKFARLPGEMHGVDLAALRADLEAVCEGRRHAIRIDRSDR